MPRGEILSYLKSRKIFSKGCMYHIVRLDVEFESPALELVPIVRIFPKVCPNDLLRIPPDQEIEFVIDLIIDTYPISFPHD